MDITAEYVLDDRELIAAFDRIAWSRRRQRAYSTAVLSVAGIAMAVAAKSQPLLGATVALAALYVTQAFLLRGRMLQGLETMRHLIAVPARVHLDDQECRIEETHRTTIWRWSAFQWFDTSHDTWLFYVAPSNAVLVPSRAFTDAQQQEIKAFLADQAGQADQAGGARKVPA